MWLFGQSCISNVILMVARLNKYHSPKMNFWKLTKRRPETEGHSKPRSPNTCLLMNWGIYAKKKSPRNLWAKHYISLPEPELVSTKLSFRVRFGWFDRDTKFAPKKCHQPLRSHVAINSDGNKAAPVWGCLDNELMQFRPGWPKKNAPAMKAPPARRKRWSWNPRFWMCSCWQVEEYQVWFPSPWKWAERKFGDESTLEKSNSSWGSILKLGGSIYSLVDHW